MAIKVVCCWSGGKDSALALHVLLRSGLYDVVSLLSTVTEGYERISMHGVRRELLAGQAESIGIPVREVIIPKDCSNAVYEQQMAEAMESFKRRGVTHVAFGDLFLADIRRYREEKLAQAGMRPLFPVWGHATDQLADVFLQLDYRAVITCVDTEALEGSFVGRDYDRLFLDSLPENVDPCGENGEFHSFVFDGPVFRYPVKIRKGEKVERGRFHFCDFVAVT